MYEGISEIMDLNMDLNFLSLKLGSYFLTTVDYNNQTVKLCLMMMQFIYIMLNKVISKRLQLKASQNDLNGKLLG